MRVEVKAMKVTVQPRHGGYYVLMGKKYQRYYNFPYDAHNAAKYIRYMFRDPMYKYTPEDIAKEFHFQPQQAGF